MGLRSRALTAGALASAAAFVVGCGTQSPIEGALSANANRAIVADLSAVSNAVSDGSCARARSALSMLQATLANLPSSTNAQLVNNLTQGSTTLRALALKECSVGRPTTTTTSSTTPTTPTSTSSTTPTTTTTTTTTQTTNSSSTLPGTGSVTQLGSGSGTSTNGGGGLEGGG